MQRFQDLGNLCVLTDPQEDLDPLDEFVSAQKDELKQMCEKQKNELFIHFEETRCKFNEISLNIVGFISVGFL